MKKQIRKQFREAVFERDRYRCRVCNNPGTDRQGGDNWKKFFPLKPAGFLDAHHIQNRNLMPNGGYVKENGISLCDDCHIKAEQYWTTGEAYPGYSPEELFALIDSSLEIATKAALLLDK